MSTWMYFRCLQHDPPLQSEDEISQHRDAYLDKAIAMAQGQPVYHFADFIEEHFGRNALHFLTAHPDCPLDVITEYGEIIPIPGRERPE